MYKRQTLDRNTGAWEHHHFYELPDFLNPGDCLILNDSRVLPARLLGQRLPGGGACEVLLLIDRGEKTWECLVRPGRHMREGAKLSFGNGELLSLIHISYELTKLVHGEAEADKAQEAARALFGGSGSSENMPSTQLPEARFTDGKIGAIELLVACGLCASNGEARRLIQQRCV